MKPEIHPEYHEITVKMTNGDTFKTRSTYGKEGDTIQLDVDMHTHQAWKGGVTQLNQSAEQVAKFNKKFGNLNLGIAAPKKAAPAPAAEAPQEEAATTEEPQAEAPQEQAEENAENQEAESSDKE